MPFWEAATTFDRDLGASIQLLVPGEAACARLPRAGDPTDAIQQCLHEELF